MIEIGTDITSIDRIKRAINRHGFSFMQRFLLDCEILNLHKDMRFDFNDFLKLDSIHSKPSSKIATFSNKRLEIFIDKYKADIESMRNDFNLDSYKISSIAATWAVKEALSKALGCGIGGLFSFHDAFVYKDINGKPYIALNRKCKKNIESSLQKRLKNISISISHDGGFAMAVCVVRFKKHC